MSGSSMIQQSTQPLLTGTQHTNTQNNSKNNCFPGEGKPSSLLTLLTTISLSPRWLLLFKNPQYKPMAQAGLPLFP